MMYPVQNFILAGKCWKIMDTFMGECIAVVLKNLAEKVGKTDTFMGNL